ncbi:transposase, IS4 family [Clostridium sp. MSTE9]|uniref:IS1182 family transposase n=1 Tax=Clostridium sp. (strain MSTE9) TaxID=1105031 RepID=UPI00026F2131|nr:IS1182 family transposase [Clostridium sp. MSTE9]EJF39028.1 transposase, IS4 family [Clostridium sp. MSTE9]EJF39185.1 transposase, IS4 family [Clostridium sp. MSTE9]
MLNEKSEDNRKQISFCCMDDLVPKDHILRKIEKAIDFSFIYDLVKDKYSGDTGRPSIDPVVLFKIVFIQYLFGIRSMRQTIKEIEVNAAYRWFLGYDWNDPVPHFTTFGKNYSRRFEGTDIFEQIFARILLEAVKLKYVNPKAVFIDSTHIKASANRNKKMKVQVQVEAQHYHKELMEEINKDREAHGKKPFDDDGPGKGGGTGKTKETKKSTTDPECGIFHKGEHEKCFAYTAHTACDRHNFILGMELSPANVHDSVMFKSIYDKVKVVFPEIKYVVADAGYKIPYICKQILDDHRIPVLPYKRPMSKEGYFKPYQYVYDEYYDCVLCPNNQVLHYSTTNRAGYREYKSDPEICKRCPVRAQCTQRKNDQKTVTRHVWADYLDTAEDFRYTPQGKGIYRERSETIERVFADAKEKHGLRFTTLRGKAKVTMQALLTFACMNLKKLAVWKSRDPRFKPEPGFSFLFFPLFVPNSKFVTKSAV